MFLGLAIVALLLAFGAILAYFLTDRDYMWLLITGIALMVVAIVLGIVHLNTAEGERWMKTIKSNTSGGIERTVEVYDQNGDLIKTYTGKLDVETNEYGNKVLFDLNGKRTIIYNATVIVQEK